MISLKNRNLVAEAQALGSSANTLRGAIRYLADQHYSPVYKRGLYGRTYVDTRRGRRKIARPAAMSSFEWRQNEKARAWKDAQAARRANPEAKRARDDAAFRRNFLARLRREEKRLVANPGPDTETAYTRLERIAEERAIATGSAVKAVPQRAWMTPAERTDRVHSMALNAGLADDWDGSSYCDDRGDHFCLTVLDSAEAPAYHAAPGTVIGLVEQRRRRVYAKRSDWRKSDRSDFFVVGQNENGNAFLHQIPHTAAGSLAEAMNWIWSGAEIIARQGDVALAPSSLKRVDGEDGDVDVIGGHGRHRFIGEIYRNGSLHVRSGFLYHTAGQHPTIYLDGSCWRRIVIGRRSERRMSTAD